MTAWKILYAILSYLLGAIPTGYLVFRKTNKGDIREVGSGNTGATNILRTKGLPLALAVGAFDVLKGFLPAFLAMKLFGDHRLALCAAFLAVFGHCYPVYIHFRGGKGQAASFGAFAALAPLPFLVALAVFITVIALTRYVSLGSMMATASFPCAALLFRRGTDTAVWGLAITILVLVRHKENIGLLWKHQERKIGEKKS